MLLFIRFAVETGVIEHKLVRLTVACVMFDSVLMIILGFFRTASNLSQWFWAYNGTNYTPYPIHGAAFYYGGGSGSFTTHIHDPRTLVNDRIGFFKSLQIIYFWLMEELVLFIRFAVIIGMIKRKQVYLHCL